MQNDPGHQRRSLVLAAGALVLSCFGAGCVAREVVAIDAEDGDLVVLASVDASGRVTKVERWIAPFSSPPSSIAEGADLFAFALGPAELIGEDGGVVPPATLAGVTVSLASAVSPEGPSPAAGACGRCLAPTTTAPAIVHAGDRCALPPFARPASVATRAASVARLDAVRAEILISWPGECACAAYAERPAPAALELEQIAPAAQHLAWEVATAAPSGLVGVFGEGGAAIVGGPGAAVAKIGASSPFEGPVLGAVGLASDRFMVASHAPGGVRESRLDLFDANLEVVASLADLPNRTNAMRALPEDDLVLLLGTGAPRNPRVTTCAASPAGRTIDCEPMTPDDLFVIGQQLWDATRFASGLTVVAAQLGLIVFERALSPTELVGIRTGPGSTTAAHGELDDGARAWRFTAVRPRIVDESGAELPDAELRRVAALGDRLYACVATLDAHLATLEDPADVLDPAAPTPVLRVLHTAPNAGCGAFSAVPGAPDRIRLGLSYTSVVADVNGQVVAVEPSIQPAGVPVPIDRLETLPGPVTLATGPGGQVYRREADGSSREVFGDETFTPSAVAAVSPMPSGTYVFRENGSVEIIDAGAGVIVERGSIAGLAPGDRVLAVAPEPTTNAFLAVGVDARFGHPDGKTWARRVDGVLGSTLLQPQGISVLSDTGVHAVARVAPDVFVLVAEDTRIFRLADDRLDEIAIDWDDPSTVEVEKKPEFDPECRLDRLRPARETDDLLRGASASGGVAWVWGCSGIVLRVLPFGTAPRAERISLARSSQTLYSPGTDGPPAISAGAALCADEVFFAARGRSPSERELGRVWELGPRFTSRVDVPIFGALGLTDAIGNELARTSVELDSGVPRAIAVAPGRVVPVFRGSAHDGSLHVLGGRTRARFADGLLRAAITPDGIFVGGSESGRVVRVRLAP